MENNFQFASAAVSDRGLSEKRPQNEDSYLELKELGLFIVADGVGGAQAGEVASQMAVEILGEAFSNMEATSDAEEVMKVGIERANSAIFQMSHDLPQLSTMATTIVALHLSGNIATIGHVGDSRLYRIDVNNNLYRETQDHSIVEEEIRAGRMTAAQAANHPSRNVISRALGAEPTVEVDLKTIMFEPDTSFLLCSDGITRHINDTEVRGLLSSGANPDEVCRQMKKICYERGAEDNLTAVIIRVSSEIVNNFTAANKIVNNFTAISRDDIEEATIASARQPMINPSFQSPINADADEFPTQDLKIPVAAESYPEDFITPTESVLSDPVKTENLFNIKPDDLLPQQTPTEYSIIQNSNSPTIETDVKAYRIDDKTGENLAGKLLGWLLPLLIGVGLGAGAIYYFLPRSSPAQPAPQITEMKTPNIPFSSFEENRRNVDRNPQQFITANAASPQDAIDFYLLGRAYLLTAKYPEASKAFNESKNRLAQTDAVNSKTLANEIAMSLAIINDPFAQKAFEKDILENNTPQNSSNTTNSNAISNR
jgi:protein phosphatase